MSKEDATKRDAGDASLDLFGVSAPSPPAKKTKRTPKTLPPPGRPAAARPPPTAPANGAGLLNVRQAAMRLGLSKSTLDKMRCAGKGPRFVKSTDRAVRYDPADLEAWIEARRRNSTSE